jgi:Regulator of ribonuclease activity B
MTVFELLTETAKADRDLLIKNDEAGDDFNKPREVDFSFETRERERANDFAEFVIGKSYGRAQVSETEPGQFQVLVLITMPINQNIINCVSGFMLCLSRLFQIEYQGWGSVIQKA